MRKLATIQKIKSLEPIDGKDRIVVASFESVGWHVIVAKNDFEIGDYCVYIEPDSILPVHREYEFLRKKCYSEKLNGFHIKTMKMSGIISQGIAFPLSVIDWKNRCSLSPSQNQEGTDVTRILKIRKYDPAEITEKTYSKKHHLIKNPILRFILRHLPFASNQFREKSNLKGFPQFLHKTDEVRVQNVPYIFDKYNGKIECYITEKLDGTSITYAIYNEKFYVCQRNFQRLKDNSIYWQIAEKYDIEKKLHAIGENCAIQGEGIGPGIQGNRYGLKELDFFVYNLFDIDRQRYLPFAILDRLYTLETFKKVPLLGTGQLYGNVDQWVSESIGKSKLADIPREGIVVRSIDGEPKYQKDMGEIFSFKVINPEYLLKYESEET